MKSGGVGCLPPTNFKIICSWHWDEKAGNGFLRFHHEETITTNCGYVSIVVHIFLQRQVTEYNRTVENPKSFKNKLIYHYSIPCMRLVHRTNKFYTP